MSLSERLTALDGDISFIGYGRSNRAALAYLRAIGVKNSFTLRQLHGDVPPGIFRRASVGGEYLSDLSERAYIVSPGVRRDLLCASAPKGALITSEIEMFDDAAAGDIFAVTGSDGKSTVTTLISLLLARHYRRVDAVGNIGRPALTALCNEEGAAYALELSSFQLMYHAPKSYAACLTGISENHLNWHRDMQEYIAAKRRIFTRTERAVVSLDCRECREIAKEIHPFAVFSSEMSDTEIAKYGADICVRADGERIYRNGREVYDLGRAALQGRYNIRNMCAAVAMTAGVADEGDFARVFDSFPGLRHRREYIGKCLGVKFYDSSIDSTPARCESTLASFSGGVIPILGGRGKNLPYDALGSSVGKCAAGVVLMGENRGEIAAALSGLDIPIISAGSMAEAVDAAFRLALRYGGESPTVLLSPASTSFDMYENFERRGDDFRACAMRIIKNADATGFADYRTPTAG